VVASGQGPIARDQGVVAGGQRVIAGGQGVVAGGQRVVASGQGPIARDQGVAARDLELDRFGVSKLLVGLEGAGHVPDAKRGIATTCAADRVVIVTTTPGDARVVVGVDTETCTHVVARPTRQSVEIDG
jgi:hypothetical protein